MGTGKKYVGNGLRMRMSAFCLMLTGRLFLGAAHGDSNIVRISECSGDDLADIVRVLAGCFNVQISYQAPAYYDLPGKTFGLDEGLHYRLRAATPFRFEFSRTNNVASVLESLLAEYRRVDPHVEYRIETNTNCSEHYVWPVSWNSPDSGVVTNRDVMRIEHMPRWPTNLTVETVIRCMLDAVATDSPYETIRVPDPRRMGVNYYPLRFGSHTPPVITNLLSVPISAKSLFDNLCRLSPAPEKISWVFQRVSPDFGRSYVVFQPYYIMPPLHDRYIATVCTDALAFFVDEIEATFGYPIGFEEPELPESGFLGNSCVECYGLMVFSFGSQESCSTVLARLAEMLAKREYASARFRIDEPSSNVFHVVPKSRITDYGNWPNGLPRIDGVAVSDKPITVKLKDATIEEAMKAICAEGAKSSKHPIEFLPTRALAAAEGGKVDFACENMAMNRCLSTILPQYSTRLSWRLRSLPKSSNYRLVIHEIGALAEAPWGSGPMDR